MKRRLHVILMAMLILAMSIAPAFAGTTSGSTDVTIETTATEVNIDVPSTLAIVFNADGSNNIGDFNITNRSTIGKICIDTISMTAKDESAAGWKLMPSTATASTLAANTKQIKFSVGKEGSLKVVEPEGSVVAATGSVTFQTTDFQIAAGATEELVMNIERGAFTEGSGASSAFTMGITFDFI